MSNKINLNFRDDRVLQLNDWWTIFVILTSVFIKYSVFNFIYDFKERLLHTHTHTHKIKSHLYNVSLAYQKW